MQNWIITRAADKAAVLQFIVFDVNGIGLDPSLNPVASTRMRKGLNVRYQVRNTSGGTWTTELSTTARNVTVDPNPKNARNGLRPIKVNATNKVTDLIMHSHGVGAGSTDDVRYVLKDIADFNVNGSTSDKTSPDEDTYDNDDSNMWEALLVARDSQDFFLHVDKNDVVVVTDRASKTSSTVADFTESDYSDVSLDYTIVDIINDVTVKITKKNKNGKFTLRNTIHRTDDTSIAKYGHRKRTFTFHNRADAVDYADEILSTNADPEVTPRGCVVPIRSESAITDFVQGIELNDKVTITDPDSTTFTVRVTATKETVTPDSWIKAFTFSHPEVKALPRKTSNTGVANVTDGQVETDFMDDKAITTAKLDDGAVTVDKVGFVGADIGANAVTRSTSTPSGTPGDGDLWIRVDGSQRVIGMWLGVSGSWQAQTIGNDVIAANIDAGKVTAGTFTGLTFQTDSSGNRIVMWDDGSEGAIDFYAGVSGESKGTINPGYGGTGTGHYIQFQTSKSAAPNDTRGKMYLFGSVSGGTGAPVLFLDNTGLSVNGDDVSVSGGNLYVHGSGHTITCDGEIHGNDVYVDSAPTTTNAAQCRMNPSGGRLLVSTSLSEFKLEQEPITLEDAKGLLELSPITWYDKNDVTENGGTEGLHRIPGVTAEDVEAHAPVFALYDGDKLQGVAYDRMASGLITIIKDQQSQIDDLKTRLAALEAKVGA